MISVSASLIGHDPAEALDRRTRVRVPIDRPAVLRRDSDAHEIRIEDLTRDGCKIKTSVDLKPGDCVTVGLAGIGRHNVVVLWCDGNEYGCVFDEPLPSGAVTAALQNNVDRFAEAALSTPIPMTNVKWLPRRRLAFVVALVGLSWTAIGTALYFLLV